MESLACLPTGSARTIKWYFGQDKVSQYLKAMGLVQGARVRVVSAFGGNVIVEVNETRIALGRDLAERVKV